MKLDDYHKNHAEALPSYSKNLIVQNLWNS